MTEVTNVVEETVEALERIPSAHLNGTTKTQQVIILGVTAAAGLLVGGGVSHILTKKVLNKKFEVILASEVDMAKEFYARANKVDIEGHALPPEVLFEQYREDAEKTPKSEYDTRSTNIVVEAPVATEAELGSPDAKWTGTPPKPLILDDGASDQPATQEEFNNIFEGSEPVEDDSWDLVQEVVNRDKARPYIVSHDEYFHAEPEFDQDELTWYAGDNVLADSQGVEVRDSEATVGLAHMAMFGHGSKDAHTVYIRNETLQLDFEVTRSPGKYAHEVMALDVDEEGENELRHSDRRPRKMRASDE